ncbi:MAG: glycosyltransferase [Pseudobutyrivibrio sp.]|nr:glycosyltransferase [Pseudobutyrivibrio sp.]
MQQQKIQYTDEINKNNYVDRPLVSIIMGVYNGEDTLREAIDSILNQTYTNWEFIICDDCSTDGTADVVKKYAERDSRIVYIKNDHNMRLAASLNHCLEVAKGKYVARMDADDISVPKRLTKQVAFLEEHKDIDVVGSQMAVFDENGQRGIRSINEYPTKEDLIKGSPLCHATIMMKKNIYENLNGYRVCRETNRAEDLDLWFRFYAKGYRAYNIQEPLYRVRESLSDLKRRNIQSSVGIAKIYFYGYKLIKVPYYKRIWGVRPIVSALVPRWIRMIYYKQRLD